MEVPSSSDQDRSEQTVGSDADVASRLLERLGLNASQRQAASWTGDHLLVLAGPGSGKTRTIIARAAWLLAQGVPPRKLLILTFTRRAAQELKDRLKMLLGERAAAVRAGTFHHFALQAMRADPEAFEMSRHVILDRDDETALLKSILAEWPKGTKHLPKAEQVSEWYSFSRNAQLDLDTYLQRFQEVSPETRELAKEIVKRYRERKRERGYLDFDDILVEFARALKRDPRIQRRYRSAFDHILVDEMQDTNPLQWIVLDALRDPAKLFCVGDDAQSIYAFRGADFRNVHSFCERIPQGSVVHLDENYRSTRPILDLANWLLAQSPLDYDKNLVSIRGDGERPTWIEFDSEASEADHIGDQLLESYRDGRPWREHLVLTRAAYLTRRIETALIEREIPYILRGGRTFLQAAHVKDLLSLLRVAANPTDEIAWIRYLTLLPKIGEVTASRRARLLAEGGDLVEVIRSDPRLRTHAETIENVLRGLASEQEAPARAVDRARKHLTPHLELRYDDWSRRDQDLGLLQELAGRYRSVAALLDATTVDPIHTHQEAQDQDPDQVTIATIHAAKGTEAEWVCVCRVEPGVFPYSKSVGDSQAEEEERRVLYVAVTRAKDQLTLTRTASLGGRRIGRFSRDRWGEPQTCFLDEVPDTVVERRTEFASPDSWFDDDLID